MIERPARPGAAPERVEVLIERGRPGFARTTGMTVRVGDVLVHRGIVTRDALSLMLAIQSEQPGERIGEMLITGQVASRGQVEDAIREVIKRILFGVMLWREGTFHFVPGAGAAAEPVTLELELDRLILEGLRLADEARGGR